MSLPSEIFVVENKQLIMFEGRMKASKYNTDTEITQNVNVFSCATQPVPDFCSTVEVLPSTGLDGSVVLKGE